MASTSAGKENNKEAGQKLKLLTRKYGFVTDTEIAKESGIDKSYINKLFKGEELHKPGFRQTEMLLMALSKKSGKAINTIWIEILEIYQESRFPFSKEDVDLFNIFSQQAVSNTGEIRHNLPEKRPEEIFGRQEELNILLSRYFLRRGRIVTISGIGGIGKTTLALQAAYYCLDLKSETSTPKFGAIIFTSAKNKKLRNSTSVVPINTPDVNLTDILDKVSSTLEEEKINRENDIKNQCIRAYEALGKQRTLLIVDNLETIEGKEEVLGFLDDVPLTTTVLVTTRHLSGLRADIPLGRLKSEDSLKIIQRQINRLQDDMPEFDINDHEKEQLQEAAGGIPIVIEYSIGLLAQGKNYYRFSDVLEILRNSHGDLASFLFEEAVEQIKDSNAYYLLMAMSILCKPFRRDTIVSIAGLETKPGWEISDGFVQLGQLSLINSESNEKFFISSLTHDYAHVQLKKNRQFESQAIERWVKYYIELAKNNGRKDLYDWEKGNWSERFDVLEEQWENLETVIEFCVRQGLYNEFKNLWVSLNNYTEVYGKWAAHFRWLKILTEQAENNLDQKTAVFGKSAIARVYIREGSEENLKYAAQLLEEANNLENLVDFPVKVELFENQIMLHIEKEEYEQADNKLQELEQFVNNADITVEDRIRYLLPFKYRKAQILAANGDLEGAKEFFRATIEDAKEIDWVLAVIGPQNRLADLLIKENKLEEAKKLLYSTLASTQRNKYHRRTAYCHLSVGFVHDREKDVAKANEHFEKSLEIFKRLGMFIQQQKVEKLLCRTN